MKWAIISLFGREKFSAKYSLFGVHFAVHVNVPFVVPFITEISGAAFVSYVHSPAAGRHIRRRTPEGGAREGHRDARGKDGDARRAGTVQ